MGQGDIDVAVFHVQRREQQAAANGQHHCDDDDSGTANRRGVTPTRYQAISPISTSKVMPKSTRRAATAANGMRRRGK